MYGNDIVLKWAITQIKKKLEEKPNGGAKVIVEGKEEKIKYTDILQKLETLYTADKEGKLHIVNFCKNCTAYGCKVCIPFNRANYKTTKEATDFCSQFEGK